MTFRDHFSKQASLYARYRPHYPPDLFEYLASVVPGHELAWDCGTGNGQSALGLTPFFDRVIATDPSEEQIRNAFQHKKITYRVAVAENPGIEPRSVDLVTVSQALHWFDYETFYDRVKQALKPEGVLAVWCYTLTRVVPEVDSITHQFYYEIVGPYWPERAKLVEDGYASLPFPFREFTPPQFSIQLDWSRDDMMGYLRSWSPTRIFMEKNGYDPVDLVAGPLTAVWPAEERKIVTWPLHMRIGRL